MPSADAVIVVLPACSPETTPLLETEAMLLFALDHVMLCVGRAFPASSSSDAESCCDFPATRPTDPGDTVTCATPPAATRTVADACTPSDVAVIVAEPTLTAVTRPLVDTVAMSSSELDQPTVRPVSSLPSASFACAASCSVAPELITVLFGETLSEEIAAGDTVTTAVSATLFVVAITFA